MNKPTPLGKKSYAEYEREMKKFKNSTEVNLNKTYKINLSVVSDIEQEESRFEAAEAEASYLAYDWGDEIIDAYSDFRQKYNIDDYIVNGATRDLEEVHEIMGEHLAKIENAANEIGVAPEDIYGNYEELRQRVDNASNLYLDAKDKYREVVDITGAPDLWR